MNQLRIENFSMIESFTSTKGRNLTNSIAKNVALNVPYFGKQQISKTERYNHTAQRPLSIGFSKGWGQDRNIKFLLFRGRHKVCS